MSTEGPSPPLGDGKREALAKFLTRPDVDVYFRIHPNQVALPSFTPPPEWVIWWDWAAGSDSDVDEPGDEAKWLLIWRYYVSSHQSNAETSDQRSNGFSSIPTRLRRLLDCARELPLTRSPIPLPVRDEENLRGNTFGMSPKKVHEVNRMTAYLSQLLLSSGEQSPMHVVDVGAGQAYLSRALRDRLGLQVLALDWSDIQAQGAAKRERNRTRAPVLSSSQAFDTGSIPSQGSLTYKTVDITQETLLDATDDWVASLRGPSPEPRGEIAVGGEVPMVFVALHACGSLTLDLCRAFVSRLRAEGHCWKGWRPRAAVVVGCCYNLLRSEDTCLNPGCGTTVELTANHLQLAAQVPTEWGRNEKSMEEAEFAIKKVAWRALLEGLLCRVWERNRAERERIARTEGGSWADRGLSRKRLGRMKDSVYKEWGHFLGEAGKRVGTEMAGCVKEGLLDRDRVMERRLEVLQVLRCIMGPVVESFILVDRREWLRKEMEGSGMTAELVNLFDRGSGSGRNVGIVIA